ncbi:SDR family oxidoreductase [Nesterenkonia lacusekhoensis]|uniref:Citronellol/citronellal dehydrogenase n=1 Tax=Nesterenkonia lacusekhoensis TaxID=150832 RepID=A0ABS4SZD6_9MICC|nr:SDR family oxidoreductase [Nesterenkonia lacusekhoensis]MBP2317255.1 citronellol/citronellal dehydrogenase [Nesterenkonia lacusekhoensis]
MGHQNDEHQSASDLTGLQGKTVVMSGGSRGIGHSIAVQLGAAGAQVVLLAKTGEPHPTLEGTVHTAVEDVEAAGGRGLAVVGDLRRDEDVARAVEAAVETFGGIDIVINNASAIDLSPTEALDMKRYDLMHDINVRGTFLLSKLAAPHLRASAARGRSPQILTLSPPLTGSDGRLDHRWFGRHLAYTMAKYGMSMTTIGLSQELAGTEGQPGVAVNSLWPVTLIETAAIRSLAEKSAGAGQQEQGEAMLRGSRRPQIVADAAAALLAGAVTKGGELVTGRFLTDEEVLRAAGVQDFSSYAVDPEAAPAPDIFL